MNSQLTKLQELTGELHEVNRQLLNEEEKDAVRAALLAKLARWESISHQITRTLVELESPPR